MFTCASVCGYKRTGLVFVFAPDAYGGEISSKSLQGFPESHLHKLLLFLLLGFCCFDLLSRSNQTKSSHDLH